MIAGSLFSGVGGADLGLARAGFDHAFFAEIDPWRRDVLRSHWPGVPVYDDVRDVAQGDEGARPGRPGTLGARRPGGDAESPWPRPAGSHLDLLCGGFPCQDLSVAGKRRGLAGARSGLFHEFARVADAVRPAWLLIENVPGLLSSNDGRDFGVVLGTLADLGYGVAWRVLDARYFGVPQRRRRVFIVGHLGREPGLALRALCESCSGDPAPRECSWSQPTGRPRGGVEVASTLKGQRGRGGGEIGPEETLIARNLNGHHGRWDGDSETFVVNALDAAQGGPDDNDAQARHLVAAPSGVRRLCPTECEALNGSTPAMSKGNRQGTATIAVSSSTGVRRLTPVECERLMSWPDGWTAPNGLKSPDSRRYAACGDGVVANVAEWIAAGIKAAHPRAAQL